MKATDLKSGVLLAGKNSKWSLTKPTVILTTNSLWTRGRYGESRGMFIPSISKKCKVGEGYFSEDIGYLTASKTFYSQDKYSDAELLADASAIIKKLEMGLQLNQIFTPEAMNISIAQPRFFIGDWETVGAEEAEKERAAKAAQKARNEEFQRMENVADEIKKRAKYLELDDIYPATAGSRYFSLTAETLTKLLDVYERNTK